MKVIQTALPGCLIVEPRVFRDERGFFSESWNRQRYAPHGIGPDMVQSNLSRSVRGVLRGLHYQWPNPQGKLVGVPEGEVFDVAVDIRLGSPTFGRWVGVLLSAENGRQLWVPEGFAHGFAALSPEALVSYQCSAAFDPDADAALRWDDAELAIDWPVSAPLLSHKDAQAPFLSGIAPDRLPRYTG